MDVNKANDTGACTSVDEENQGGLDQATSRQFRQCSPPPRYPRVWPPAPPPPWPLRAASPEADESRLRDVRGGEADKQNLIIFGGVETELSLRQFLEDRGHEFVFTSNKDGDQSEFAEQLHDSDVIISQPFWPAYITLERVTMEPKLKLTITAGIGSDHVNLAAACDRNIRWPRSRATSSAWPITSS
ncbi:hypothetical protein PF008_g16216 [Phytophthora fragariae]|uniref:D-isomer specific 2-hydroxyacid dehydrogenase catalytic domain-containing protein n=1 Tax=Phytophthora fragariae TaxID=53985 RepID=A0A6G0RCQ3_9STRA|nr:hypothetical protein PF008_g16216 [Phytophthora fragariae]